MRKERVRKETLVVLEGIVSPNRTMKKDIVGHLGRMTIWQ